MEFKVSELEREPVEFDLELEPGAIDFGEEAEQMGELATSGRAEVIHEHRGPKEIVPDIRLRGRFAGAVSRFPAPAASSRSKSRSPPSSTSSSGRWGPMPRLRSAPLQRRKPKSVIIKKTVCRLKMCCASRCFCPCRSGRCASPTARDFARAAEQTATPSPAPAMRVRATPAGRR